VSSNSTLRIRGWQIYNAESNYVDYKVKTNAGSNYVDTADYYRKIIFDNIKELTSYYKAWIMIEACVRFTSIRFDGELTDDDYEEYNWNRPGYASYGIRCTRNFASVIVEQCIFNGLEIAINGSGF